MGSKNVLLAKYRISPTVYVTMHLVHLSKIKDFERIFTNIKLISNDGKSIELNKYFENPVFGHISSDIFKGTSGTFEVR